MIVYFVTGNAKKIQEASAILPGIQQIEIDLPEIQSLDPEEIIREKLLVAHKKEPNKHLIVEDVSYSVAGLQGLPGTFVKWFMQTIGPSGLYNLAKDKDTATTVSAHIGYITPEAEMRFFVGSVEGKTVPPDGEGGFYFDSIFMPKGYDKRYSEMTREEKNTISHRSLALRELSKIL
jgi:inosine triphosphate pyrophosphatase